LNFDAVYNRFSTNYIIGSRLQCCSKVVWKSARWTLLQPFNV